MRLLGKVPTVLALMLVASCGIDDEDRCADGYEFDKEHSYCIQEEETDSDSDTGTGAAVDAGADADGGGQDGGEVSGMGVSCKTAPECENFDADYCAIHPLDPSTGYCTLLDCMDDGCPGEFRCCDCTGLGAPEIFCMKNADAQQAEVLKCQCN